jgi:hypothetical protein
VTITLATRLAVDPHVRFRRFEDEGVVINQKTAEAIVVSEVAARLLEMADGARSLEECAALIGEEFDADQETIERDLLRFASELVENGIAGVVA